MAGEDDKGKARRTAAAGDKLDRRDVLMGLSTVPALGLFGYAWNKQRSTSRGGRRRPPRRPPPRADLQEINVALLGAGAQGQVLMDAMLASRACASARCATSGPSTTSGASSTP